MSTTEETEQRSISPAEIPFSTPDALKPYITDTGKILPRKYTHLSAKEQRRITKTVKRARNLLFAQ
ncbi:MAG: 30S ribosomal protein S18 [Verrucomicrobiia bacterium]|tara:strand:- start:33853 stop:34050 length:198 start_codon:yes stop_codon:yes gene_type:complete